MSKSSPDGTICPWEWPRTSFERIRRITFEGEHVERMAALNARMKLSPGVIKMLMRLSKEDGISMGDMARGIGVDPSYITALVDDLDQRGLARREPAPDDRRVKIIVLTDEAQAGPRDRRDPLGASDGLQSVVTGRVRRAAGSAGQGSGGDGGAGHRPATKVEAAAAS